MNEDGIVIKVGIADMNIVHAPNTIRTSGLGSCVGVILYDLGQQVAGLAHIMLPDSTLSRGKNVNAAKFADTAVEALVKVLQENGARTTYLKAKIAGGAQMFQFATQNDMMKIGERNSIAVKRELARLQIPLVAEDIGGSNGRTIEFNPKTGRLFIKTVNKGSDEI
ncbi:chemotaxis protein CheD [Perspicuibacillus lycopersici]|nr:chemotaxis protein CheD [Perspicuibacillus lycopersici]